MAPHFSSFFWLSKNNAAIYRGCTIQPSTNCRRNARVTVFEIRIVVENTNHPQKLTYLYQKLKIIAISRWLERQKAEGPPALRLRRASSEQQTEGGRRKAPGKESKQKRITSKHPYSPIFRTSMSSISPFLPRASISFVNPDREKSPRRRLSLGPSDEMRDAFLRISFRMSIPTGLFDHLHSAAKTGSSPATATRSISAFPFHHRPARS